MTDQTPSQGSPKKEKDPGGKRQKKRKPLPEDGFDWLKASRTLVLWILLVLVTWIVFRQLNLNEKPEVHKSYSQYQKLLESGQVDGAEIIDKEFHGRLKDGGAIVTILPFIDAEMVAQWDSLKIDYQFREKTTSWLGILLTTFLPWIVFIAIWIYFMRRMQGGGGSRGVFSFGKSRAKLSMEGKTKITFADVAGCDEAKEELQEVISFLRDPKKFSKLGGRIPKGALLLGPPGTGKTLLARAVAGEAEVPFFSMSGADFVEMFVGVGAARVRDLFETGKKHAPCIIFIDEIDAVGRHRGAGLGGGHDEREQTLNQLLVEMDGFEGNDGVILIAATNRPDVLDPALTRPGRFDRQIVVDRPDVRGREGILRVHTRNIPISPDVKLEILAKGTPGLAGADLANLVNEAALLAARRNAVHVAMVDFEEAKDKVMMGTERKSMLIAEDEKKQTAIHEAGHVLVAKMTPGADPVHKVTIIPRGRALGLTHYLPLDEKHNYSRTYLRQTLTHLLGGRVAERIVFNELSTGAGNDIERATEIARRMVCEWGMSDRMGPIAFGKKQEEIFLGREISQHRDFSERTAQEIDSEVRRIVSDAEKNADRILREHIEKLRYLADALLDREILDGDEIDILLKGGKLPPLHPKLAEQSTVQPKQENRGQHQTRRDGKPGFQPRRDDFRKGDGRSGQGRPDHRRPDSNRPDSNRPDVSRPEGIRLDVSRPENPRPEIKLPETPKAELSRPEGRPAENKPSDQVRNERDRQGRPNGDAGRRNTPSSMRRDFARSYGVVSSRDPENRRPTSIELSRMKDSQQRQEQSQRQDQPPRQDQAPRQERDQEAKSEPLLRPGEPRLPQAHEPAVSPSETRESQGMAASPEVQGESATTQIPGGQPSRVERTPRGRRPQRPPRTPRPPKEPTEKAASAEGVEAPSGEEGAASEARRRSRARRPRVSRPRRDTKEPTGGTPTGESGGEPPRNENRNEEPNRGEE